MRISKIFAGMSALAMAAALTAPVTADEAPQENGFYEATGHWVARYDGSSMDGIVTATDPAEGWGDSAEVKSAKGQLVGYTNQETGKVDTYNLGFNFQVGHMKKAIVTIKVTSDSNNIWQGDQNDPAGGSNVSEAYMYTVQTSWNGDCAADYQEGWTHSYNEDGSPKMSNGACDLNEWNSGAGKFNGVWAQITLSDDNYQALHFEVTVDATEKTAWEYHPYNADKADENKYVVINAFGGNGGFSASSVEGDGNARQETTTGTNEETGETFNNNGVVVDGDYINAQFGGECSPEADNGDSSGSDSSSNGDSSGSSSNGSSSGSSSSGSSSKSGGSNGGSNGGSKSGGSTTTGTSTSSTGDGSAASDATANADSGAAAGVGLAIAALAGAAVVVSRRK